ncbi:MAG: hypothetical protein MHPSP_001419 [Paramarteilia canceri]
MTLSSTRSGRSDSLKAKRRSTAFIDRDSLFARVQIVKPDEEILENEIKNLPENIRNGLESALSIDLTPSLAKTTLINIAVSYLVKLNRPPLPNDYLLVSKKLCEIYPNLYVKLDKNKKYRNKECARVSKMRSFISSALDNGDACKQLEDFTNISAGKRKKLAIKTFSTRFEDIKSLKLNDVLKKWPFLKYPEGIRLEFKILCKIEDFEYLTNRLYRTVNYDCSFDMIVKVPSLLCDSGKIMFIVRDTDVNIPQYPIIVHNNNSRLHVQYNDEKIGIISSAKEAFIILIMVYKIFNVQKPDCLKNTLTRFLKEKKPII